MSKLIVKRDSGYADRARKYKIYCNSSVLGVVGNGETVSFELPAGQYEIYFKIDWGRSNKVAVSLEGDETITISVGSNLRGWKLSLAAFYIFLMPHKYLWAECLHG